MPLRFLDLWHRHHGLTGDALENLRLICEFMIAVYYKQWFAIKRFYKLAAGPGHMLKQVQNRAMKCSLV